MVPRLVPFTIAFTSLSDTSLHAPQTPSDVNGAHVQFPEGHEYSGASPVDAFPLSNPEYRDATIDISGWLWYVDRMMVAPSGSIMAAAPPPTSVYTPASILETQPSRAGGRNLLAVSNLPPKFTTA